MRKLTLANPSLVNNEKTYLDADYISGTDALLISSFTFAANDLVVVGTPGEKLAEGAQIQTVVSNKEATLLNALNFNHLKGTTMYRADWDTFSIEGFAGANQNWQVIKTLPIQWDKLQTLWIHVGGDDTWSYRFRLYNSVLNVYSEYSPTLTGAGFSRLQVGQMILNVRKKIRDVNRQRFSDPDIIALFNDAQNDATTLVPKLWFLLVDTWESAQIDPNGAMINPGLGLQTQALVAKYSMSQWSDIDFLDKIKYYYTTPTGGQYLLWDLQPLADIDFDRFLYNQNRFKTDITLSFKLTQDPTLGSAIVLDPMPLQGGAYLFPRYWKKPKQLAEITDATDFIFPAILEDFAAWRLHDMMGNDQEAKDYQDLYYGPSSESVNQALTGIKLLQRDNNLIRRANGYGRKLWNYRGRRGPGNFFGNGLINHDFIKEQGFDM